MCKSVKEVLYHIFFYSISGGCFIDYDEYNGFKITLGIKVKRCEVGELRQRYPDYVGFVMFFEKVVS